jgi:glycosyltransferase involved in cell wall biosynthesis
MTVYIVDIEPVESRYTAQWKKYLPEQIKKHTNKQVKTISGGETPQTTTPGAFLNFGGTNVYKSKQLEQIGEMFCNGQVKKGDYFLYTDAWNPTVIQLRYMAELLGINIHIGGIWHAGSYDPADFLGRLIGAKSWVRNAEASMFACYDDNFYATDFHINLFKESFEPAEDQIIRTGFPFEYMPKELNLWTNMEKTNTIVFPHRIAPEKQVDIFRDLADNMPEYEWIVCQEKELSKSEYHNILGSAKLVFSANLQETLGISWYEGALVGALPMVPDRLSYTEMAIPEFKYPSEWTESFDKYLYHKEQIINKIKTYIEDYTDFLVPLKIQTKKLNQEYFSGDKLYRTIGEK